MSAKTIIATVVGFLTHHVADLNNLSDALSGIVGALPIDSQDKERFAAAIEEIKTSAANIEAFLSSTTVTSDAGEVVVKESDIVDALANFLKSETGQAILADALKAVSSAEGNVSNG